MMQKITPFLWFDNNAEEAMNFYVSIFGNAKVLHDDRVPGGPADGAMLSTFQLEGLEFYAFNGGPYFKHSQGISFTVSCDTRQEIDHLWEKLTEGGVIMMPLDAYFFSERYGWVQDRFGISWQLDLAHRDQKIAPSFLFVGSQHGHAEEAMKLYCSLFEDSGIGDMARYEEGSHGEPGTVMHAAFKLAGQEFMAMDSNGPHEFEFTSAISFLVSCEDQAEVDRLWAGFTREGQEQQCGWVLDKFGIAWQIIPAVHMEIMRGPDRDRAKRATAAMLKMKKFDIAALLEAANAE